MQFLAKHSLLFWPEQYTNDEDHDEDADNGDCHFWCTVLF